MAYHYKFFGANTNPGLARSIAQQLGCELAKTEIARFSDGEIKVSVEENVRGAHAVIIQSIAPPACNDSLMEIILLADALRRASVASITAVIPYYGYARQDRRVRSARVPISAKVVADMLATVAINRVITIDLHADQIQGFFDMPVDNIYTTPLIQKHIDTQALEPLMVVSPDIGGVVRARAIAKALGHLELAIIDKRRLSPNESQAMHIIGSVAGKNCIIIDDIIDTAGTLCNAAKLLKEHGAAKVCAYITHPVLSGPAINRLESSVLDTLVVTNSIELPPNGKKCAKICQLDLSELLAETMRRISRQESVSSMFS